MLKLTARDGSSIESKELTPSEELSLASFASAHPSSSYGDLVLTVAQWRTRWSRLSPAEIANRWPRAWRRDAPEVKVERETIEEQGEGKRNPPVCWYCREPFTGGFKFIITPRGKQKPVHRHECSVEVAE